MKHYVKKFFAIFGITLGIGLLVIAVAFGGAILGYWGSADDIDIEALTLRKNSSIVYIDENGKEVELQKLNMEENRVWVDIEGTPEYLQQAFVAIEDERFYEHRGFDLPRTTKATLTWIGNKLTGKQGASLGGSTITQQLIKNITGENDQTPARKVKEIATAVGVEKQLDKQQILELYMNCIYLSQGCNGVQTAADVYFGKNASELTLAESASLAGITQFPSKYDPFVNPEANKERQEMVLKKMLELDYITQEEYDNAVNETLQFVDNSASEEEGTVATSYFVDQVIRDVTRDLQKKGYSESLAHRILYSGGVKVYTTYNPRIQKIVEDYYENSRNFPGEGAQSAIVVTDVATGQVVGIAGGIGEKPGSLTWNRASMSTRQPGSTIKPIAIYAPAIDMGVISPGSVFEDEAKAYDGWVPRNYDYEYRGKVNVQRAIRTSLNTTPVDILWNKLGVQQSFDYLEDKMGITTLVEAREQNGKIYTDLGGPQLALGGLTDGATVLEMSSAFATFANNGVYNMPYTYTDVKDKDGNIIVSSDRSSWEAMRPSTAYIMSMMLRDVVTSGTGVGAGLGNVFTAGKTGTTSDNKDRWFVGYTPYYSAAVWYGYDIAKEIPIGSNPCIPVFRNIMSKVHSGIRLNRSINKPSDVTTIRYCDYTGMRAKSGCPSTSYYCSSDTLPAYCNGRHVGGTIFSEEQESAEPTASASTPPEGEESATATTTNTPTNNNADDAASVGAAGGDTASATANAQSGTAGAVTNNNAPSGNTESSNTVAPSVISSNAGAAPITE